jgi:hypothetical protein
MTMPPLPPDVPDDPDIPDPTLDQEERTRSEIEDGQSEPDDAE